MSSEPAWSGRRLHFVGVGGAGMSGLALVARELGAGVSGSDRSESAYLGPVRDAGIAVAIGEHAAANVPAGAEVVYSTAVGAENPERRAGREGAGELHRGALLGELTALRPTIAVTGTHGKTTTAAMAVAALDAAGLESGYVIGAELAATGRNAHWGAGEWLVVEADESDRSLLELAPRIAVVTNAELDHHATYGSRLELEQTLRSFLASAADAVVWNRPGLVALRSPGQRLATFDVKDPVLSPGGSRFALDGLAVELSVPGEHNARNAAAALVAARLTGADLARAARGLAGFRGTGRRFERLGETRAGVPVYDDYAHHPTEVRATLEAARTLAPRRLVVAFQPHLYSRTAALAREFGEALALADLPVVLELYAARERAEEHPGISGRLVAEATADAAGGRPVVWMPTASEAEAYLRRELRAGDLCMVLGAGPIDRLGRALVA